MHFTWGEIIFIAVVAIVLAGLVGGYMVYTRRKGLM